MTCTRRDVLYTIGIATATAALHTACGGDDGGDTGVPTGTATMCGTNICFSLAANPELQAVGGIVFFSLAGKKIFVQKTDTGFLALSAICTHAGCTVAFNGSDQFNCPCHGSQFNAATGAVIFGPAVAPLPSFATSVNGDEVTITLA
ncbi:MAG TPA: Rieske (2Fe-2S) protein [Kofleriaceae bacterium]|nr:Rieske (2Fe-2S) protein [Kofleriaceae bacterium]